MIDSIYYWLFYTHVRSVKKEYVSQLVEKQIGTMSFVQISFDCSE